MVKAVTPSWTWASGVTPALVDGDVVYTQYQTEEQLEDMTRLFSADLSEPYSVFTYRYFLHLFPQVAFLVRCRPPHSSPLCRHPRRPRPCSMAMLAQIIY